MRNQTSRKLLAILVLAPLMLGLAACSAEDISFLRALALSWAAEHAGDLIKYGLIGRSGNDEVDAVMDAKGVIDNINAADKLMEEGRQTGDLTKMEQAIKKRPGDYTYRVTYASQLFKSGRTGDAVAEFEAADQAAQQYGAGHAEIFAIQGIDELSLVGQQFEKDGFADRRQCQEYNGQMSYFYGLRYLQTNQDFFQQKESEFAARSVACQ